MADEFTANYMGIRHAPKAEVAQGLDDVGGTSSLLNQAGRTTTSSRRPGLASRVGDVADYGGPLRLDSVSDIISASGLGPREDELSVGERLSDANEPTQTIRTQPDGSMIHHRANADGSVTSSPLGAYDGSLAKSVVSAPWYNAEGEL
jgi:hypothetical protein